MAGSAAVFAGSSPTIPPAPQYYLLDEPHVLQSGTEQALQSLLYEHNRVTGGQFVIAIFNTLGDEDVVDWTNKVFQGWRIGARGQDNGILLALYWKEHRARIEVGYGLEPILTDAKSSQILSDVLIPELKNGNPDRAVALTATEILQAVGSPLIQSGKAEEILNSRAMSRARMAGPQRSSAAVWLYLGIIMLFTAIRMLLSGEAHFTGDGWYRPRPWQRRNWRGAGGTGLFLGGLGGWGGGGGGWGGGGGGGFIGGGGMSGGGGASGSW